MANVKTPFIVRECGHCNNFPKPFFITPPRNLEGVITPPIRMLLGASLGAFTQHFALTSFINFIYLYFIGGGYFCTEDI